MLVHGCPHPANGPLPPLLEDFSRNKARRALSRVSADPGLRRNSLLRPLRHCTAHTVERFRWINYNNFAKSADVHAETLWMTNKCQDRRREWILTDEGLRFMTAPRDRDTQIFPLN